MSQVSSSTIVMACPEKGLQGIDIACARGGLYKRATQWFKILILVLKCDVIVYTWLNYDVNDTH